MENTGKLKLNKQITMLNTNKITGRADFQREIDPKRVVRICKKFDENQMRPIQVADIPNMGLIIWDGQHTAAAARMANNNQDLMVPCIVNRMSYEEAAELVAKQEENKAKLHIVEQFRSSVESGDVDDENIAKLLKQHGITLSKRYSENSTAAVNALRQVHADSYHNLDVTLQSLKKHGQVMKTDGELKSFVE